MHLAGFGFGALTFRAYRAVHLRPSLFAQLAEQTPGEPLSVSFCSVQAHRYEKFQRAYKG